MTEHHTTSASGEVRRDQRDQRLSRNLQTAHALTDLHQGLCASDVIYPPAHGYITDMPIHVAGKHNHFI